MAKNRIFELPVTKGSFQLKGIVSGVEKDNFYIEKKTKNGGDFRAVNFGVTYADKATVFININGMQQDKVYFSKRNPETKKIETKAINWSDRNTFNEEGYAPIGVTCGLEQKTNEKGNLENIKKTMVNYDACEYINAYLEDNMSLFMSGNIEFNSFLNNAGETVCRINYRPNRIYACKNPIDFDEENYEPQHDFKQKIVFKEIIKDNDSDKERFVVYAWIVNYNSIENAEFIIEDKNLATLFKKNLKEYTAIDVSGDIVCRTIIEKTTVEDCWGVPSKMDRINHPTIREMVITGALPATIDTETYSKKEMEAAFESIRKANAAEDNFEASNNEVDEWGNIKGFDDSSDDTPW